MPVTSYERFWAAMELWAVSAPTSVSDTLKDLNNGTSLSPGRKGWISRRLNNAFDVSKALITFTTADLKDDLTLRVLKNRSLNHFAIDDRLALLICGRENSSTRPGAQRKVVVGAPFERSRDRFLGDLRNDLGTLGGLVQQDMVQPTTTIGELDRTIFTLMNLGDQLKDVCRRWARREVSSLAEKLEDIWVRAKLPYNPQAKQQLRSIFLSKFPGATLTQGDLDQISTVRELEGYT